jgi:hypothetical protein
MEACGINPEAAVALVAYKREISATPALTKLLRKLMT